MSETCWAHKKWNKIANDIKLVFYSSTITMMHGPINIRFNNEIICPKHAWFLFFSKDIISFCSRKYPFRIHGSGVPKRNTATRKHSVTLFWNVLYTVTSKKNPVTNDVITRGFAVRTTRFKNTRNVRQFWGLRKKAGRLFTLSTLTHYLH